MSLCIYCGCGLVTDIDYAPYGSTVVSYETTYCEDEDCLGEDTAVCDCCGVREWQTGDSLLFDGIVWLCFSCNTQETEA
jgi:hypothetical protein